MFVIAASKQEASFCPETSSLQQLDQRVRQASGRGGCMRVDRQQRPRAGCRDVSLLRNVLRLAC